MHSPVVGQIFPNGYDSLPLAKPKAKQMLYITQHPQLKEIALKGNSIKQTNLEKGEVWKDLVGGALTIFFGDFFSMGSTQNVLWEIKGALICNDNFFNWNVNLFCTGTLEKEKERIRNEDGSYSVETTSTGFLDWHKGAVGFILERQDTIGRLAVFMDPHVNPSLKPWSDSLYAQPKMIIHTISANKWYVSDLNRSSIDYAITGLFRGRDFMLFTNGTAGKSWFYIDKTLICIFQPDINDNIAKKEDRIMPYLLLNKSIPQSDQPDWYRLAVVSRFLSGKLVLKTF